MLTLLGIDFPYLLMGENIGAVVFLYKVTVHTS